MFTCSAICGNVLLRLNLIAYTPLIYLVVCTQKFQLVGRNHEKNKYCGLKYCTMFRNTGKGLATNMQQSNLRTGEARRRLVGRKQNLL